MLTVCKRHALWRYSPTRACVEHDKLHENVDLGSVNNEADGWDDVKDEEEVGVCDDMRPIDTSAN